MAAKPDRKGLDCCPFGWAMSAVHMHAAIATLDFLCVSGIYFCPSFLLSRVQFSAYSLEYADMYTIAETTIIMQVCNHCYIG